MITDHAPSEDGAWQAESGAPTLGRQFLADHRDLGGGVKCTASEEEL